MEEVYIVAAQRTAIGKFGGALAPLTAAQLGAAAIKGALAASGLAAEKVDQVLMGNVIRLAVVKTRLAKQQSRRDSPNQFRPSRSTMCVLQGCPVSTWVLV